MQDDTSADVQANDDIADEPLFPQTPVAEQAAPEAPSEPAEQAKDEGADTEEVKDTTDDTTTEAKDTEATAEQQPATEQQTEKAPDQQLAYRAYQERQRTRQAVEQKINEVYGPKTEAELYQDNLDSGLDEEQAQARAEIQALREEMQYATRRTEIAELNASLNTDALNAANDFPVYNDKSPEYDEDFAKMVGQAYATAARIQADDNGIILNAELPFYDFYKRMAEVYNRGSSKGATKAQAEAVETLSRVEAVSGGSSSTNKHAETLEEMGERLADLPLI